MQGLEILYFVFQNTLLFSIPLMIVAIGGMFCERSGIVNVALEGIMVVGALASISFISLMQSTEAMSGNLLLLVAILIAAVSGLVFSLLHAYASINMRANQVISGTALNMIAPAAAVFLARTFSSKHVQQIEFTNQQFEIKNVPFLSKIPVIGPMLFQNSFITTYIGFGILIVAAIVLYKTRFGLRLRACGEHPQAADSVGINVYTMRYAGVMISGALGGIGGLVFVVPTSTNFNATVSGYGFLALAVLIFGQWKPFRILFASLFFGVMQTIAAVYSALPVLKDLGASQEIYRLIPYIATLIVLAISSKNSQAPRAEGIPYDKGSR